MFIYLNTKTEYGLQAIVAASNTDLPSKYLIFEVSGSSSHSFHALWDQEPQSSIGYVNPLGLYFGRLEGQLTSQLVTRSGISRL